MLTAISRFDSRNPSTSAAPSSSSQSGAAPKGPPSSSVNAAAPTGPTSRDFTLLILELHRLLHCMENDHTNTDTTNTTIPWQGLERRMELLQSLWQNVQRFWHDSIMDGAAEISPSEDTPTPKWYLEYEQRVYRASQKAQEAIHALQRQEKELYFHTSTTACDNNSMSLMMASQTSGLDMTAATSSVHSRTSASRNIIHGGNNIATVLLLPGPKLIQQVFFANNETKEAEDEVDDDDDDDDGMADIVEHDLIGQPMPSMTETNPRESDDDDDEPQRSNTFRNNNNNNNNSMDIAAFQKAQREQIEQAIAQMAQQMKQETERIHQTLQGQTKELLEEMEDIAIQNVDQVTAVTQDVTAHVQQGWTRTWGTYTLLILVASLFLFSLTVIYLIPKYNSPIQQKTPSQLCRMVNGKEECLDVNAWLTGQQRDTQQPEPQNAPSIEQQQQQQQQQQQDDEGDDDDDSKPDLYDQAVSSQEQQQQTQAVECEIDMDGSRVTETSESMELKDMKLLLQKRAEEEQQRAWEEEQKRREQKKLKEDEEEQKRQLQQQLKQEGEARRKREREEQQRREMQQREQEQQQQTSGEQLAQQTSNEEESQWQDDQDQDPMREEEEEEEEEEENSEDEEARKRRQAQQWRQEADSSDDDDDDDDDGDNSQIPGGDNGEEMTEEERLIEEELRRMEAEEQSTTEEHSHEHHHKQQQQQQAQASMQTGDYPEGEWTKEKERLLKERADRERLHVLRQMQEQGGYSEQDLEQILAERERMRKHREEQLLRRDEFREKELRQLEYLRQQQQQQRQQQQQQQQQQQEAQHPFVKESQEQQNTQEAQESAPKEAEEEEISEDERRKREFWARQKAQREEAAKKREEQRLAKERQHEEARQREEEERRKAVEQENQEKLAQQEEQAGAREGDLSNIKGFGDWEPKGFGSFAEDAVYRPRAHKEQDLKGTWNANLPKGFGSFLQDDPPPMGFGGGGGFAGAVAGANTAGTQAGPGEDAASVPPEPEFRGAPFAPRDIRRVAASGDIDTLRDYLDQRPGWVDRADKNSWTALHLAVRAGHQNIVEVLLAAGANVNGRNVHEQTPLSMALERMGEQHPITMVLRNYGAEL